MYGLLLFLGHCNVLECYHHIDLKDIIDEMVTAVSCTLNSTVLQSARKWVYIFTNFGLSLCRHV